MSHSLFLPFFFFFFNGHTIGVYFVSSLGNIWFSIMLFCQIPYLSCVWSISFGVLEHHMVAVHNTVYLSMEEICIALTISPPSKVRLSREAC